MKLTVNATAVLAVAGLGLAAFVGWRAYKAAGAAAGTLADVANAVNPFSDQNLAYRGVNAIGASITGDKDFNLGTAVYNVTHDDPFAHDADTLATGDFARMDRAAYYGTSLYGSAEGAAFGIYPRAF